MSDTMKFVLEQIASGAIDKQVGLQLVKRLRAKDAEPKADAPRPGKSIAVIGMSLKLPIGGSIRACSGTISFKGHPVSVSCPGETQTDG